MAYASESLALAALEQLTYWGRYSNLHGYQIFCYRLDEEDVEDQRGGAPRLDILDRSATRSYGDAWARERRTLALMVPSVVLPHSSDYLINPSHPRFDEARIAHLGPLVFDDRIQALLAAAKAHGT